MITCLTKFGDELPPIDFIELQWNRKYHEAGSFALYMAAKDYNPDVKYIQVKGRPETGVVQKTVYEEKTNGTFVTISGFFIEKLLDCAAGTQCNIVDASGSSSVDGYTTAIMLSTLFCSFFSQETTNLYSSLPVETQGVITPDRALTKVFYETLVKPGVGIPNAVINFEIGEPFGDKLFKNLQKYNCSYSVKPLFKTRDESKPLLGIETQVWKGRDLRETAVFGDSIENVKQIEFMEDETGAKVSIVAMQEIPKEITNYKDTFYAYENGELKRFIYETYKYTPNMPTDLGTVFPQKIIHTNCEEINANNEAQIRASMRDKAKLELLNNYIEEKISVDVIQNKVYYLKDYDLGDICTIVIDRIKKMYTARIVEVNEVFSKNKNDIEIVLGTPTKQKYRRII